MTEGPPVCDIGPVPVPPCWECGHRNGYHADDCASMGRPRRRAYHGHDEIDPSGDGGRRRGTVDSQTPQETE